jgi:hypothetical protein
MEGPPKVMSQGEIIHQHLERYLVANPKYRHQVEQLGDGEYRIEGREVKVGFCRQGFLVVHDGPLRQPFTDYVEKKEASAVYHHEGLKNSSLTSLPKATRISFGDEDNRYSRLDAMKIAKEQAIFREKAASCVAEGQAVPADLREKYEKNISIKLGTRHMRPKPEPIAPTWWPAPGPAGAPVAPQASAALVPNRPPSYVPQVPSPKAALFGQVPDLVQIAQARAQTQIAPVSTTGPVTAPVANLGTKATTASVSAPKPTPGMVATAMPLYAATSVKATAGSAAASGYFQRTIIAGPLCGA